MRNNIKNNKEVPNNSANDNAVWLLKKQKQFSRFLQGAHRLYRLDINSRGGSILACVKSYLCK